MSDWILASDKLGKILADRFFKARCRVPTDEVFSSPDRQMPPIFNFSMDTTEAAEINMGVMNDVVRRIDEYHKKVIRGIIDSVGEVVDEFPTRDDVASDLNGRFAGEDDSHVLIRVDCFLVKISKETATKILALGFVPASN
jgi:hypothetical protein